MIIGSKNHLTFFDLALCIDTPIAQTEDHPTTVLVLGATGFIGSRVTRAFRDASGWREPTPLMEAPSHTVHAAIVK